MNLKAYEDVSQKASNISAQKKIATGVQNNGLVDMGVLTQDEFDKKKREIMGL